MFGKRRKAVLVSAALVSATMLMTACQDSGSDSNSAAAQGSSSATPGGAVAPSGGIVPPGSAPTGNVQGGAKESTGQNSGGQNSGGQGTSGGTGSGDSGKVAKCRTDDLKITAMDGTISDEPEGTVAVELKNGGGQDCTMSGFAGVDLKTSAGSLSAQRTGQPADPIILKSGQSVFFGVTFPLNNSGGSGVRITGLLVTPPGETKSVTLDWPGAGTLPVTDGAGSPVKVGPLGSAGQGG